MMTQRTWVRVYALISVAACISDAGCAFGQGIPPFFSAGSVAFDPEISVISSGALLNARATVSADRKYVNIGAGATNAQVQSIQPFPVNAGPQGFVGGISLPGGNAINSMQTSSGTASNAGPAPLTAPSPAAIERSAKSWVFTRQGMYLVAPLK